MNVAIVGAGPAGLYLAILLKRDDPRHQVTVYERNKLEDTFGFGVVFSDETLENVGEADPETNQAMAAAAAHWEEIEIHYRGTVMRSTGHRFSSGRRYWSYSRDELRQSAWRCSGSGRSRISPTVGFPPPI